MNKISYVAFALLVALSCGGKQSQDTETGGSKGNDSVADDLDVPEGLGGGENGSDGTGDGQAESPAPAGDQPPVTFRLENGAESELAFSLDRGWQPVIFAYSGTPPNAKGILMFPKFCTAACDAGEDAVCPVCAQPERVKDIKAAEKREILGPGDTLDVPWDGEIFKYKKTRGKQNGKRASCDCYSKAEVPPETYTVKACGLRITKSAKKASKLQCVEGTMSFPSDGPQVVELKFPKP